MRLDTQGHILRGKNTSVHIGIIAVPERSALVDRLQSELGDTPHHVYWDHDRNGCWWNSRRVWLEDTPAEWTLVLTDDAQVGENFGENLIRALEASPGSFVSLIGIQQPDQGVSWNGHIHARSGVALAIHGQNRRDLVEWSDANTRDDFQVDDWRILTYAGMTDGYLYECVPNLVEHRVAIDGENIDSCIYKDRFNHQRTSATYCGDDVVNFSSEWKEAPLHRPRERIERDRQKSLRNLSREA